MRDGLLLYLLAFAAGPLTGCFEDGLYEADAGPGSTWPVGDGGATPPPTGDWVRTARIAGTYLESTMPDDEVRAIIATRAAENASVLELDTRLSLYLDDAEFEAEASFLDRAARMAHAAGLRAVVYYPALEVLSPGAADGAPSMYGDHPDWVQLGLGGEATNGQYTQQGKARHARRRAR